MASVRRKLITIMTVMAALSFSSMMFVTSAIAAPTTFTVNVVTNEEDVNIGDGICETANTGECTLRAAIQESNASQEDLDTIGFNIPGSGVRTIDITADLPQINDEVVIDGYTQPGSLANTAVAPQPLNGTILVELKFNDNGGLNIFGENTVVRGLSIFDCSSACVGVYSNNITIHGNYLGLRADGLSVFEDGESQPALLAGQGNDGVTIGGVNPAERNIIVNNNPLQTAVSLSGSEVVFYGNYVGIGKDGVTDLGGELGLSLNSGNNDSIVGGPLTGQANLISGADTANLVLQGGSGHKVQGNLIGTDYTGALNDGITNGVGFTAQMEVSNSIIGGVNPGEGNILIGASGSAVLIQDMYIPAYQMSMTPAGIAVIGNTISDIGVFDYPNFGDSNSGIELIKTVIDMDLGVATGFEFQGPNPNDVGDVDTGANGHLNFPVLKTAQQVGSDVTVTFDLDVSGSPSDEYRVEFFANDVSTIFGYGPGQIFLGAVTVGATTSQSATLDIGSLDIAGQILSSTVTIVDGATDSGFGSTSEFSQNIQVGSESDFDADGIADATEDQAPNDGDGNDDGTLDRLQATVSSYMVSTTPVTFVTDGCSSNGSVSLLSASSLSETDTGFSYPYGLTDFTLNCSRGDTVTVTKYVFDDTDDELSDYSVRKYRPNTQVFEDVEDSTVVRQLVGGRQALVMSYSLTDGGALDDDGEANGVIVDPVGLAHVFVSSSNTDDSGQSGGASANGAAAGKNSAHGVLATTGPQYIYRQLWAAGVLLGLGFATTVLDRRPRRKVL